MGKNNDVFQVLVTKGNQSVLGAGNKLENLNPGQIGVFDSNTNLSIDGSASVKEFFLAVGVDRDNDNVSEDVNLSAGQTIQTKNVKSYTFRPHTASRPMIFEISDFKANCDTEYGLKLEFRNQEIYKRQGYNQFTHTYLVKTECCKGCEPCPSGDCNKLAKKIIDAINADPNGLVKAEAIDPSGNVVTDIDTFIQTNEQVNLDGDESNDVCLKIRITTIPLAINKFCSINTKYYYPRGVVVVPSLIAGFSCSGKITVTQEAAFEEGNGYDIKQKEYEAGGWNGKPGAYRTYSVTGLAKEGFEYFANVDDKYDQIVLSYDQESYSGWGEYKNPLATIIAVPESDTTTRDSLITVLDNILTAEGFDALTDDASIANINPNTVESTEDINNTSLDGIG